MSSIILRGVRRVQTKQRDETKTGYISGLGSWLHVLAQKYQTQRILWGSKSPKTKQRDEGKTGYILHWALGSFCLELYLTLEPTGSWHLLPVQGLANAESNLALKVRAHACRIEQAWFWWRRKNEQSHLNLALKFLVQACRIEQVWYSGIHAPTSHRRLKLNFAALNEVDCG